MLQHFTVSWTSPNYLGCISDENVSHCIDFSSAQQATEKNCCTQSNTTIDANASLQSCSDKEKSMQESSSVFTFFNFCSEQLWLFSNTIIMDMYPSVREPDSIGFSMERGWRARWCRLFGFGGENRSLDNQLCRTWVVSSLVFPLKLPWWLSRSRMQSLFII